MVYVGHIPHGFYEKEMKDFFSQFGTVKRLRLSRSREVLTCVSFYLDRDLLVLAVGYSGRLFNSANLKQLLLTL